MGRIQGNAYNVIWPDRMSECSRYESLMCDCQADVTGGGYLRNVCCHHWLSPSSWCQSLARPHSFPHQHQDHQGWLWLALVISCLVIILHISHLWQLFLLVREDEKKALSLSPATTNTKITTDRLWAESLEMEMYSEFEGIVPESAIVC